ncbi:hypothetical protein BLOT_000125 [Blomia tropicalis]|nr:hypothetical protein BLOT_000125 [Blomia tropicalis]
MLTRTDKWKQGELERQTIRSTSSLEIEWLESMAVGTTSAHLLTTSKFILMIVELSIKLNGE